jgi:alanyl aminopeptidase
MGDKIADRLFPEYKISVMEVRSVQYAMGRDTLAAAQAIRKPIDPGDNPLQSFGVLAYMKGEGILGMVEQWIGEENFRRGVLHYLKAHEAGNAAAEDFFRSLSQFAGRDIGEIMAPFLNQPGIPLVEAALLPDGRVQLTQRRLLHPGNESPPARWPIPVVLRYPDGDRFMTQKFLLTEETESFRLKTGERPAWIHPNADERGYYRWSVPPEMRERMLRDARSALNVRERVALLGHLPALLDAGSLHGDDYLKAIAAFNADFQPEVVLALIDAVDKVRSDFVAPGGAELEEPFTRYVQATLGPALRQIGLSKNEGEEEIVSLLRSTLIAWLGREGKDPKMLAFGRSVAASFLQDPASVDTDLTSAGLELSAVEGDRALFENYKKRFETAATPSERARFLSALGRFRDPVIVASALQYALEGPLRPQEILAIPQGIAADPRYRDRVFDWVTGHYEELRARRPARSLIYLPFFAGGCSIGRLEKAQTFFSEPSHRQPGIETELKKLEEGVLRCVRLREREGRSVSEYLQRFAGGTSAAKEE